MRLPDNLEVWVVEDDALTLVAIEHTLSRCGWKTHAFSSVCQVKARLANSSPGCLVTDLCIGDGDGLELIQHVHEQAWPVPSILISGCLSATLAARAMRAGATMVLEKPFSPDSLIGEVSEALQQASSLRARLYQQIAAREALESLSIGQQQVLNELVDGRPHKQIASRLNIALRTVELRKKQIFDKLQVETFTELLGLVHASDQERSPLNLPRRGVSSFAV